MVWQGGPRFSAYGAIENFRDVFQAYILYRAFVFGVKVARKLALEGLINITQVSKFSTGLIERRACTKRLVLSKTMSLQVLLNA